MIIVYIMDCLQFYICDVQTYVFYYTNYLIWCVVLFHEPRTIFPTLIIT
jgi:hypothetical protein